MKSILTFFATEMTSAQINFTDLRIKWLIQVWKQVHVTENDEKHQPRHRIKKQPRQETVHKESQHPHRKRSRNSRVRATSAESSRTREYANEEQCHSCTTSWSWTHPRDEILGSNPLAATHRSSEQSLNLRSNSAQVTPRQTS